MMRFPSGDHAGGPTGSPSPARILRGFPPSDCVIQISCEAERAFRKAICDPSGDTAGDVASSVSLRGAPPIMETFHKPGGSFGAATQIATRCVPSGNQLAGRALNPAGNGAGWTSPVAISVSYTHLRAHETPEHLVCR